MLKSLLYLAAAVTLSSCSVSVPALAKTERGETFMGEITATMTKGSYSLQSLEGHVITGTYDPKPFRSRSLSFEISDGRRGTVLVNSTSATSGYGFGKLNTGERCMFSYGNNATVLEFH